MSLNFYDFSVILTVIKMTPLIVTLIGVALRSKDHFNKICKQVGAEKEFYKFQGISAKAPNFFFLISVSI